MIKDLTKGGVAKTLLAFSWPFIVASLLQTAYGIVDMIVVGQTNGQTGLSAISNGADLVFFATTFGMAIGGAGQILIAQFAGAKNWHSLQKTIGTLFTWTAIIAIVLTAVMLAVSSTALGWLRVPGESFGQAVSYTHICFAGLLFIFGYNVVGAVLRGMGDSIRPMVFIAIAAVLNLVLDVVFVVYCGWGAAGAAWATVIGQGVSCVVSIMYLFINREGFGFDFRPRSFIPHGDIVLMLLKLGGSMVIQYVAINLSFLFVNSILNAYGVTVSAVTGVGNKIGTISLVLTNALMIAGSSMVGQSMGAGKVQRVDSVVRLVLVFSLAWGALLSAAILLFPREVFRMWTSDASVLDMAAAYAPVCMINLMGFAVRTPSNAFVNGIGNAGLMFVVGVIDSVVMRLGLAMLFWRIFDWGYMGVWYGTNLAGLTPFIIVLPYYLSRRWVTRKLIIDS
ncbi:MAG: MATE family efflux transporter [Lachnospiraceae bacterium]|jgi:putative MATE family efflux protein|nr:MATE family efflux transporter [Lachnospiraceae bacterium]